MPYIGTRNSKLGINIPSINLPAHETCRPDAPCWDKCYARKGNFVYPSAKKSVANNLKGYLENPKGYFECINAQLQMVPYRFLRYHSSGDIVDAYYFNGMCWIARKNKKTQFLCFTKKDYLINNHIQEGHKIPKNLVIVLSAWGSSFMPENPFNLPMAYVKLKKEECIIPVEANECSGFCGDCCDTENSCWRLKKGQSVFFHQH